MELDGEAEIFLPPSSRSLSSAKEREEAGFKQAGGNIDDGGIDEKLQPWLRNYGTLVRNGHSPLIGLGSNSPSRRSVMADSTRSSNASTSGAGVQFFF